MSYVNPRAGRSLNLVMAIVMYMLYSNMISVTNAWVGQAKLSPLVGMISAHALMIGVTALMFYRRVMLFSLYRRFFKSRSRTVGEMISVNKSP